MVYLSDTTDLMRSYVRLPGTGSDKTLLPTSCDLGRGSSQAASVHVPETLHVINRVATRLNTEGPLGVEREDTPEGQATSSVSSFDTKLVETGKPDLKTNEKKKSMDEGKPIVEGANNKRRREDTQDQVESNTNKTMKLTLASAQSLSSRTLAVVAPGCSTYRLAVVPQDMQQVQGVKLVLATTVPAQGFQCPTSQRPLQVVSIPVLVPQCPQQRPVQHMSVPAAAAPGKATLRSPQQAGQQEYTHKLVMRLVQVCQIMKSENANLKQQLMMSQQQLVRQ